MLSVTETAQLLGIHRNTLYIAAARGDAPVPPVRIGGRVLFRSYDVDRFLTGET